MNTLSNGRHCMYNTVLLYSMYGIYNYVHTNQITVCVCVHLDYRYGIYIQVQYDVQYSTKVNNKNINIKGIHQD